MGDNYRSRCPNNFVWRYFAPENFPFARCTFCGDRYICQQNTLNFQNHLMIRHRHTIEEIRKEIRRTWLPRYLILDGTLRHARCIFCNVKLNIFNGIEYLRIHMFDYHNITKYSKKYLEIMQKNNPGVSVQQSVAEEDNASTSADAHSAQRAGAHSQTAEEQEANNENQSISDKCTEIKQKEIRQSHRKKKYSNHKEHRHIQHAELDSNSTESKETDNENNNFSKDILLLHTAIKSLTVEVKLQNEQIMLMRNAMEQTLQLKIGSMTVQKFTEKHNVTLKLQNIHEFKNFEQRLIEDKQFRTDFKASLKSLTEQSIYKTILTILKRFLDRHLAMQLTAVRQSKDKYVIKETVFYITLFDLSCDNCTGENGESVTEKDFNKTLGSIFKNAKDWDGQRNIRRLLANAHRTNNEEDNEACVHDAV